MGSIAIDKSLMTAASIIAYAQYAQEELAQFSPQIVLVNKYNQMITKMHLEEERSVSPFKNF